MDNSYWDQFESSDDDFFSQFEEVSPPKSKVKKTARVAGQVALGAAERALMPYELAAQGMYSPETKALERRQDIFEEIANLGTKKRNGTITLEEEQELAKLIQESKDPAQTLKSFEGERSDKSFLKQSIEGTTGIDTKAEGVWENAADWYGFLKDPKKSIKSIKSLKNIRDLPKKELIKKFMPGTEAISSIAAGVGSENGELGKVGLGTGALVLSSIISNLKKGKLLPASKEMKELYRIGKELGLSEKEITPIVQSRFKLGTVGSFAQPSKRGEKAIEVSESALGRLYDEVSVSKNANKQPNREQLTSYLESLEGVIDKLKKPTFKSDDRTSLIKKIEEMGTEAAANGISPERIVEDWLELNRGVNWNSISKGDKLKQSLKEPLKKLFDQLDPQNSKKFAQINKLWSRLQRTADKVRPTETSKLVTKAEGIGAAKGIFDLVTKGSTSVLEALIGAKAARLIATEMLINPKLNDIMNKTIAGLGSSSEKAKIIAVKKLVDYLRSDKKYKDEGEWEKLYSI